MNEDIQPLDNKIISPEDGITDYERQLIKTPVKEFSPEHRHMLVAIRDKMAAHNYALNDTWKAERKREDDAKQLPDVAPKYYADQEVKIHA